MGDLRLRWAGYLAVLTFLVLVIAPQVSQTYADICSPTRVVYQRACQTDDEIICALWKGCDPGVDCGIKWCQNNLSRQCNNDEDCNAWGPYPSYDGPCGKVCEEVTSDSGGEFCNNTGNIDVECTDVSDTPSCVYAGPLNSCHTDPVDGKSCINVVENVNYGCWILEPSVTLGTTPGATNTPKPTTPVVPTPTIANNGCPQILSVSPTTITITGEDEVAGFKNETIVARYSDSDGVSAIERGYVGMSQCSINPGAAYASNFEHNLANYFGANYNIGGSYGGVATNNAAAACTDTTAGSGSPWTGFWDAAGHTLDTVINPNSMIKVLNHTRVPNVVSNTIDFFWNVRIDTNISANPAHRQAVSPPPPRFAAA